MNERPANRRENWRGARHFRVGIEVRRRSVRVVSLWVVDQPAVQRARLADPIVAHIAVAGEPAFVQAVADPRIVRGTAAEGRGHSYLTVPFGVAYLTVPFTDALQLTGVRVQIFDAGQANLGV